MSAGAGYPVGDAYVTTLQQEIAPSGLDLALLMRRRQPPPRAAGFRYADLGCGAGFGLMALAAAYPEGRFHGVDLMPGHIAWARRFADEAGLDNVTFEDADFADLGAPPGGRADYVALHGVYTWVSEAVRRRIADILAHWVAPGGVVYVGHNALPAWAEGAALRRIFRDTVGAEAPDLSRVPVARGAVEAWLALGGASAGVREIWERLRSYPDRYLLHELGAPEGGAMWSADVTAGLAPAGLAEVGLARLHENFDALRFDEAGLRFLADARAEGMEATARDLLADAPFRMAVYARGAPPLASAQVRAALGALRIEAVRPVLRGERQAVPVQAGRGLKPELAEAIAAALGDAPTGFVEAAARLGIEDAEAAAHALTLALATGAARVVRPAAAAAAAEERAARFNRAVLARRAAGEALPGLVSARLGMGFSLTGAEFDVAAGTGTDAEIAAALARAGLVA